MVTFTQLLDVLQQVYDDLGNDSDWRDSDLRMADVRQVLINAGYNPDGQMN